jgi:hypothetical protein
MTLRYREFPDLYLLSSLVESYYSGLSGHLLDNPGLEKPEDLGCATEIGMESSPSFLSETIRLPSD